MRTFQPTGDSPRGRAHLPLRILVCALALATSAGCSLLRHAPPPPIASADVIAAVQARASGFRTVTDTDISLVVTVTADGERDRLPTLGGFIAFDADLPALWLDTEKVSRRIFSLKAVGDRFWLALFDTREVVTGGPAAFDKLPQLVRPEEVKGFFAGPDWLGLTWPATTMALEEESYRFDVRVLGVRRRAVTVDRRDLVVTSIRRYDSLGRAVTEVGLSDYARVDGALFPRRLSVERPLSGVKVELRLSKPILNKQLPAETFLPPERPGWRVIDLDRAPLSAVEAFRTE